MATIVEVPIIRVEDWDEDPPLATKYICGENVLDLETVYKQVKGLKNHSGRGRLESVQDPITSIGCLRLRECDEEFLNAFWDCLAKLLDYFADFVVHDGPTMQSVWFHLLDELQDAGNLPHRFWQPQPPFCSHAEEFSRLYEQTLQLINVVITPNASRYSGLLVRPGIALSLPSDIGLGGFKAGLKSWQQFLYNGSPGFDVPEHDRDYPNTIQPSLDGATSEQYVPQGALAIVHKHTERLRSLTAGYAQRAPDGSSEAELLSRFDQHSIKFGSTFAYTSIDGRETLVQPMCPNRISEKAPQTYIGYGDPDMIERNPDLNLLDEGIGNYKGLQPFTQPDDEDDFQMWHVTSTRSTSSGSTVLGREEYGEMFDEFSG